MLRPINHYLLYLKGRSKEGGKELRKEKKRKKEAKRKYRSSACCAEAEPDRLRLETKRETQGEREGGGRSKNDDAGERSNWLKVEI